MAAAQLLQILADVADAMAYLHPDIVHRDLKSQNGEPDNRKTDVQKVIKNRAKE